MRTTTIRDLNSFLYIVKLLERDQKELDAIEKELDELRAAAGVHSPGFEDMPRAPGPKDIVGNVVPRIVDKERQLKARIAQYTAQRDLIEKFIERAPNLRIRLILKLRHLDFLTWSEVADSIGGRETEASVKQAYHRYLYGRKSEIDEEPIEGQVSVFEGESNEKVEVEQAH